MYKILLISIIFLLGCSKNNFKEQLDQTLTDNPEILFKVLEKHSEKYIIAHYKSLDTFNKKNNKDQTEEDIAFRLKTYESSPVKWPTSSFDLTFGKGKKIVTTLISTSSQFSNIGLQNLKKLKNHTIKIKLTGNKTKENNLINMLILSTYQLNAEKGLNLLDFVLQKATTITLDEVNQWLSKEKMTDVFKVINNNDFETYLSENHQLVKKYKISHFPSTVYYNALWIGAYPDTFFKKIDLVANKLFSDKK